LWVRAFDGVSWSGWTQQTITAPGNHAPTVTVSAPTTTISKSQTESLASVFSAGDPDRDAISQYQVWLSQGAPLGSLLLNGTTIAFNQAVSVGSSLPGLVHSGPTRRSSDVLWVRAFDGVSWSGWTQQTITAPGNRAPTVTVSAPTTTISKSQTESLAS